MDSMLQIILDSKDEVERARLRDELILVHSAPLVRKVLRQNLELYIGSAGNNPNKPDAEDLYHDTIIRLIQRLDVWIDHPDQYPIKNYRNLVITITVNGCNDFLRKKSRARAQLKNSLRDLFHRNRDLKSWKGKDGKMLCGFSVWKGQAAPPVLRERVRKLQDDPEEIQSKIFPGEDVQTLQLPLLVARLFRWLDGPVEIETLTEIISDLKKVKEQPIESIEQGQERSDRDFADRSPDADLRLQSRETLRKVWEEIKQLPSEQRAAVCLSLPTEYGGDLWDILIKADVASLPEIASDLGLSIEEFVALWDQTPMDSSTLAEHLGATRQQVNKWRFRALERLKQRLSKPK